jgi:hypothetical protein
MTLIGPQKLRGRPCHCGCGQVTKTGAPYVRGHHFKAKTRPRDRWMEKQLAMPVTSACVCGWKAPAQNLDEARFLFERHRAEAHPLVPEADVPARRAAIRAA